MTPGTHAEERPREDAVRTVMCKSKREASEAPKPVGTLILDF